MKWIKNWLKTSGDVPSELCQTILYWTILRKAEFPNIMEKDETIVTKDITLSHIVFYHSMDIVLATFNLNF